MTADRAALVGLIDQYVRGLLDPFVTLLEVHKLMYFQQEAGHQLNLKFSKARYGPYAESLRHVLSHVEGHLLSGYADGGDRPGKQLELVPGAVRESEVVMGGDQKTQAQFARVAELVAGFETPFGLELLATVNWVATREGALAIDDVKSKVYSWNNRNRRFSTQQIEFAYRTLREKGWLEAATA